MEDKAKKILIESFKDVKELNDSPDFPSMSQEEITRISLALFRARMRDANPSTR
jgi:hypothetical protein